jgi:hypothetical protein
VRQLVGRHAVGWEMNAPGSAISRSATSSKAPYPFAIMVNATGKRFVDEAPTSKLHLREVRPRHSGAGTFARQISIRK